MGSPSTLSARVRERSVRMVLEQQKGHEPQWAAIGPVEAKVGCSPETLRERMRRAERHAGRRPELTTGQRERLRELVRENEELVSIR